MPQTKCSADVRNAAHGRRAASSVTTGNHRGCGVVSPALRTGLALRWSRLGRVVRGPWHVFSNGSTFARPESSTARAREPRPARPQLERACSSGVGAWREDRVAGWALATQGESSGAAVSIGALDTARGRRAPTALASPPNKALQLTIALAPPPRSTSGGGYACSPFGEHRALAAQPRCSTDTCLRCRAWLDRARFDFGDV